MLDTLETLIAFVTVVLVLSLLVTGLVQLVQYTFRFRGRTLEQGLAGMLASLLGWEGEARRIAHKVVHDPWLVQPSNGPVSRWLIRVLGSLGEKRGISGLARWLKEWIEGRTTWIEKGELKEALARATANWSSDGRPAKAEAGPGDPAKAEAATRAPAETVVEPPGERTAGDPAAAGNRRDVIAGVEAAFGRWERLLTKRFQHRMRWISVAGAFLVVFLFQVDGFALLRDLSADAELRARISALTGEVLEQEAGVRQMLDLRDAAEEALERLEARHREVEAALEQASGVGSDRASIIAELEAVLADRPAEQRNAILAEYEDLLNQVIDQRRRRARGLTEDALGLTSRMGLRMWSGDWDFYYPPVYGRYLGVLVMVLLVSFGAPFWFNALRNLVALRDLLKPKETDERDRKTEA